LFGNEFYAVGFFELHAKNTKEVGVDRVKMKVIIGGEVFELPSFELEFNNHDPSSTKKFNGIKCFDIPLDVEIGPCDVEFVMDNGSTIKRTVNFSDDDFDLGALFKD
jgi:hypothetical protein